MTQRLEVRKRQKMMDDDGGSDSESESDLSSNLDHESDTDSASDDSFMADPTSAKAGVIEKIVLKNFMCHDFFELELGPQLNFIIGRNGSGKSAILTGISVGLGAKASETCRGSSVRDLIKDRKEMAKVILTFRNEGEEAYCLDVYGKKIIIERTLKRLGTNSYSIKSEVLNTISTKKSTLDEILFKYNIAVNNPLAFLSQDKAREFLTLSSDQSKFKFFMDGTLLNDITNNLEATAMNTVEIRNRLNLAKRHLKLAEEKYRASAALYEKFQRSDSLRKRLEILHGKAYWFNVTVIERKLESYKQSLKQAEEEICGLSNEIININERVKFLDDDSVMLQTHQDEMKQIVTKFKDEYDLIKDKRRNAKTIRKQLEDEIQKLREENNSFEKEIRKKENEIALERELLDKRNDSKETLSNSISNLNSKIEELNKKKDDIRQRLGDMIEEPTMSDLRHEIGISEEIINSLSTRKIQIQKSEKDILLPWGDHIHNVLNSIKAIKNWHQEPIGPLGAHISVRDEFSSWKDLINTVLGKTLDSFLVIDEHDRRILDRIFKQLKVNKNIITRRPERITFEGGRVRNQITFFDMLAIDNENVLFTLIDINNIEKNIIASSRNDFDMLVKLPNVLSVFSSLGLRSGIRASAGDNGTLRIDPVHYRDEIHKLSSNSKSSENYILNIESQIQLETEKLTKLRLSLREANIKNQNQRRELEEQSSSILVDIKKFSNEVIKMEDKLNENGDLEKVEALKIQVSTDRGQISINENIITSLVDELEKGRDNAISLKAQLESSRERVTAAVQDLDNTKTKLEAFADELASLNDRKTHSEMKKVKLLDSIEAMKNKLELGREKLAPILETAELKCCREIANVDINRDTSESISKEYQELQRQVQEVESSLGRSFEEIQRELLQNKKMRDAANDNVFCLDQINRTFESELNIRFQYLVTTISKNESDASSSFERSLALRGFKGELRFNHPNKSLTLLAQTKNDQAKRTVDSLSGGEKSFTQIALLLAIWKVMDTKVRGLDEFDVYMDSVNRSISIKLLLSELRRYPKSQAIFITPQDIAVVGDLESEDVKIHKMTDPRKNN